MTPEDANKTVEDAMNSIMAKDAIGIEAHRQMAEYEELATIYMSQISDWTVQLAYIVADKRWDRADNAMIAMNQAVQKLAGAICKLIPPIEKAER